MTDGEAEEIFQHHDRYAKSLRWRPLAPLLHNLDIPRTEHIAKGTTIVRTAREWCRSIRSADGKESAHCDVVNGGTDQMAYLVFPPQSLAVAEAAIEDYRRRLYPFQQREQLFRDSVGPPLKIKPSKRVIANIDLLKCLASGPTHHLLLRSLQIRVWRHLHNRKTRHNLHLQHPRSPRYHAHRLLQNQFNLRTVIQITPRQPLLIARLCQPLFHSPPRIAPADYRHHLRSFGQSQLPLPALSKIRRLAISKLQSAFHLWNVIFTPSMMILRRRSAPNSHPYRLMSLKGLLSLRTK